MKRWTYMLTICALLAASPALASDPWSPIKANPTSQLTDGVFAQSPLKLPFPQVSVRNVPPDTKRVGDDFEHVYDVPYAELMAHFEDEQKLKDGFQILDARVFPEAAGKKFKITGTQRASGGKKFHFHNPHVSRDFTVTFRAQGNKTIATFHNIVLTKLSSGVMPARVGFRGYTNDLEIPFNWN